MPNKSKPKARWPTDREERVKALGEGVWIDEPDRVEFASHGFRCLILRSNGGNLNGYVAVPPAHPWHKKHYTEPRLEEVSVHGGLTYSDGPGGHIRLEDGADLWFLGFDCGHAMDFSPGLDKILKKVIAMIPPPPGIAHMYEQGVYRDLNYVRSQVALLAAQALDAVEEALEEQEKEEADA